MVPVRQMGWLATRGQKPLAVIASPANCCAYSGDCQVVLLGGQALPLGSVQATRYRLALKRANDGRQEAWHHTEIGLHLRIKACWPWSCCRCWLAAEQATEQGRSGATVDAQAPPMVSIRLGFRWVLFKPCENRRHGGPSYHSAVVAAIPALAAPVVAAVPAPEPVKQHQTQATRTTTRQGQKPPSVGIGAEATQGARKIVAANCPIEPSVAAFKPRQNASPVPTAKRPAKSSPGWRRNRPWVTPGMVASPRTAPDAESSAGMKGIARACRSANPGDVCPNQHPPPESCPDELVQKGIAGVLDGNIVVPASALPFMS